MGIKSWGRNNHEGLNELKFNDDYEHMRLYVFVFNIKWNTILSVGSSVKISKGQDKKKRKR